jgi:hypothetical protein
LDRRGVDGEGDKRVGEEKGDEGVELEKDFDGGNSQTLTVVCRDK